MYLALDESIVSKANEYLNSNNNNSNVLDHSHTPVITHRVGVGAALLDTLLLVVRDTPKNLQSVIEQ